MDSLMKQKNEKGAPNQKESHLGSRQDLQNEKFQSCSGFEPTTSWLGSRGRNHWAE